MYCFDFSTVIIVIKVTNPTFSWISNQRDYMHFFRRISKTFQWTEVVEKMGLQQLWTSGGWWALKGKPLSKEEHSQSQQTPHLTKATSFDANPRTHNDLWPGGGPLQRGCRHWFGSLKKLTFTSETMSSQWLSCHQHTTVICRNKGEMTKKHGLLSHWTPMSSGQSGNLQMNKNTLIP